MTLDPGPLRERLEARLDDARRAWLAGALQQVVDEPPSLAILLPGVGRKAGRGPLDPEASLTDVHVWSIDDAARVMLISAAGPGADLDELYRGGDAAERRAVLRALPYLDSPAAGRGLVDDAIRTNDPRLIAAALGPYAIASLTDEALEQAVLKCVFVGIPLTGLAGLEARATPQLARMLAAYAHERVAAGRPIAADVWPLVARFPPEAELAAIAAERGHAVSARRAAADQAWADYTSAAPATTSE